MGEAGSFSISASSAEGDRADSGARGLATLLLRCFRGSPAALARASSEGTSCSSASGRFVQGSCSPGPQGDGAAAAVDACSLRAKSEAPHRTCHAVLGQPGRGLVHSRSDQGLSGGPGSLGVCGEEGPKGGAGAAATHSAITSNSATTGDDQDLGLAIYMLDLDEEGSVRGPSAAPGPTASGSDGRLSGSGNGSSCGINIQQLLGTAAPAVAAAPAPRSMPLSPRYSVLDVIPELPARTSAGAESRGGSRPASQDLTQQQQQLLQQQQQLQEQQLHAHVQQQQQHLQQRLEQQQAAEKGHPAEAHVPQRQHGGSAPGGLEHRQQEQQPSVMRSLFKSRDSLTEHQQRQMRRHSTERRRFCPPARSGRRSLDANLAAWGHASSSPQALWGLNTQGPGAAALQGPPVRIRNMEHAAAESAADDLAAEFGGSCSTSSSGVSAGSQSSVKATASLVRVGKGGGGLPGLGSRSMPKGGCIHGHLGCLCVRLRGIMPHEADCASAAVPLMCHMLHLTSLSSSAAPSCSEIAAGAKPAQPEQQGHGST